MLHPYLLREFIIVLRVSVTEVVAISKRIAIFPALKLPLQALFVKFTVATLCQAAAILGKERK